MKRIKILTFAVGLTFLLTPTLLATHTAQFNPTEDTFVKQAKPTTNYGSNNYLRIRGAATNKEILSYLKFDVNDITGTITSAKLKMKTQDKTITNAAVYDVNGAWSEGSLTWNTDNLTWGSQLDNVNNLSAYTWYEWDVQSYVAGDGTYSLGVKTNQDATLRDFDSSEAASNKPILEIIYTDELHVQSIASSSADCNGGNDGWQSIFDVTVMDEVNNVVADVNVTADWGGVHSGEGTETVTTDANGIATFTSGCDCDDGNSTLTITDLARTGYSYDSNDNVVSSKTQAGSADCLYIYTIQAEDCNITAISGSYISGSAPNDWPGDTNVVRLATSSAGGLEYGCGEIKFAIPVAIPDCDYLLSVRWHTGTMDGGKTWAYSIGADSGSVMDGAFPGGQWHYFYPGDDVNDPNKHNDQWFTDYLAGPNGMTFTTWTNTPVRPYLTLSNIGSDDLYIKILDTGFSKDNSFGIDYFVLHSVYGLDKTIHVEAEDCNIADSDGSDPNSYWLASDPWVYMATDANGNVIYGQDEITFYLPDAIPDGNYLLEMGYAIGAWAGVSSSFKIAPSSGSSGTIAENGIATQNGWHNFDPNGSNLYQIDELAGPNGLSFPVDPCTPIATSLTVSGIGAKEFAIHIWDQSAGTYDHFAIDYFELIPLD